MCCIIIELCLTEASFGFFLFVHSIVYIFGHSKEISILAEKDIKKKKRKTTKKPHPTQKENIVIE